MSSRRDIQRAQPSPVHSRIPHTVPASEEISTLESQPSPQDALALPTNVPGAREKRQQAVIKMQAAYGNAAVRRYLARRKDAAVTEDCAADQAMQPMMKMAIRQAPATGVVSRQMEYIKDAWKHLKQLTGSDEGKKDEGGDWAEPSEEVALHTKEALALAKFAAEKLKQAMKDDPDAAEKMAKLAENFEEASTLVETGEKGFNTIKKGIEIKGEIDELYNAAKELKDIDDLRANPERSAKAFDNLFGATGTLAKRLPDGPWQGYFELLAHFNDHGGFFQNMTRALGKHARDADLAFEGKSAPEPEAAALPAVQKLEQVGPDVERKFAAGFSEAQKSFGSGEQEMEAFRTAYQQLMELNTKAQGGFLRRTFGKPDAKVLEDMKPVAEEVWNALQTLSIVMVTRGNNNPAANLMPDMDVIKGYM